MGYSLLRFTASILLILLSLQSGLFGRIFDDEHESNEADDLPWLAGPLLSPGGTTTPPGHVSPSLYYGLIDITGRYNQHGTFSKIDRFRIETYQLFCSWGVTDSIDIRTLPAVLTQIYHGKSTTQLADWPVGVAMQICREDPRGWRPNVRLTLTEIIPTGKFDNLDALAEDTDSSGLGAWGSRVTLSMTKLWRLNEIQYFKGYLSGSYTLFTHSHVDGINTFGGSNNTHGVVSPGSLFISYLSWECNLTKHFGVSLDTQFFCSGRTRFKGYPGTDHAGNLLTIGRPFSYALSMAPALQYNFTKNCNLIAGWWFTLAGHNASSFAGLVVSFSKGF